jgi:hypothetical protein
MMETVATLLGAASLAAGVAVTMRRLSTRQIRSPTIPPGWLPVLSTEALTQHLGADSLIASIRVKTGLAPTNFERDYAQTIGQFMAFVQLLPASESHHHAQPGGLLLHALETAILPCICAAPRFCRRVWRRRTSSGVSIVGLSGCSWRR